VLKKDGETKVFIPRKNGEKTASADDLVRYTVDDLVKDSEEEAVKKETKEEAK
jgi:hypothetical protein